MARVSVCAYTQWLKSRICRFYPNPVLRSSLEFFGLQFLPEKGENGASFEQLPHNASQLGGRGRRRNHIRLPALSLNGCVTDLVAVYRRLRGF